MAPAVATDILFTGPRPWGFGRYRQLSPHECQYRLRQRAGLTRREYATKISSFLRRLFLLPLKVKQASVNVVSTGLR